MPKAYDEPAGDQENYTYEILEKQEALENTIAASKPIVDLCALLSINVGLTTLFFVLIKRAWEDGFNLRLTAGIIVTFIIGWIVQSHAMSAIGHGTEIILLKLCSASRAPYDLRNRNLLFSAMWNSIVGTLQFPAVWGLGLMCSELVKASV